MKLKRVKAVYCNKTNKLIKLTIDNKNNLSHKYKVEFKKELKQLEL